jgi:hypothetical protein
MTLLRARQGIQVSLVVLAVLGTTAGLCGGSAAAPTPVPPTAAPTDAPEPTATSDLSILFEDDFSDPGSGWPTVDTGGGSAAYADGVYRLSLQGADAEVAGVRPGAFADFTAETDVVLGSASGQAWQGLIIRQVGADNYYSFVLNPAGQAWQALKRDGAGWQVLGAGTNPAIGAGPARLRLDANGAAMTFSIDGTGLVQVNDEDYPAGDLGYLLRLEGEGQAQLDADLIIVRRFDAATVPSAPLAEPPPPTETPVPTETGTPEATGTAGPTSVPATRDPLAGAPQTATAFHLTATAFVQSGAPQATATAFALTAQAVSTQICGLPGFPPCP